MGQPVPETPVRVPLLETVDAIDPAWMDRVLAHAGVAAPKVLAVAHTLVGQGTTSAVTRLSLTYAPGAGDGPATLVAKFPSPSALGEAASPEVVGYAREVEAYRYFGAACGFRVPACLFAEVREDGWFNLILADLGTDCRPGDQIAGCTSAEAFAVARELAGLHAAYWQAPGLASLDWVRRRAPGAGRSAAYYAHGAKVMRQRFADVLSLAELDLIDAAVPLVAPWAQAAAPVESLLHGDPRVDNIMFADGPGGPVAWLIDLQQMMVGDPAFDLAYFMGSSLAPADRAACEREVIAAYAARIRAAGHDLTDAAAWAAYQQQALAALTATVQAAGGFPDDPKLNALITTMARRACAAVVDLDGLAVARGAFGPEGRLGLPKAGLPSR